MLSAIAIAGMLTAGIIAATASSPTNLGDGSFSAAAQAAALIALAAALTPSISTSVRGRPAISERDHPTQGFPGEVAATPVRVAREI
jgi:hypothetical protein